MTIRTQASSAERADIVLPPVSAEGGKDMARSNLSEQSFEPAIVSTLLAAYDAVWGQVEPVTDAHNLVRAQEAISDALLAMARAGQLNQARLEAYALDRARAACAGTDTVAAKPADGGLTSSPL